MENTTGKNINRVFIWILVVIFFVFALCCVTPYTYSRYFVPTITPVPTQTPKPPQPTPTKDVTSEYIETLRGFFSRQASLMNTIGIMVGNSTIEDTNNPEWRNDLYSKYDELLTISENAMNLAPPAGWEYSQEVLTDIHNELVLAKSDLIDFVENKNPNGAIEYRQHMELVINYLKTLQSFYQQKGYW